MKTAKKALSLVLSFALIASTVISTSAFAETPTPESAKDTLQNTYNTVSAEYPNSKENLYDSADWKSLINKLSSAKDLLEDTTGVADDQYNSQNQDLNEAVFLMNGNRTQVFSDLTGAIETAIGMASTEAEHGYDSESYAKLTTDLTAAKGLKSDSSQYTTIKTDTSTLNKDIQTCQKSNVAISNLIGLSETAESISSDEIFESTYTSDSQNGLKTALTTAKNVIGQLKDLDSINHALKGLQTALNDLKINSGKTNDVVADITKIAENQTATTVECAKAAKELSLLSEKDKDALRNDIKALNDRIKTNNHLTEESHINMEIASEQILQKISVESLSLAAGITNETGETVRLDINQKSPSAGETARFNINLTREDTTGNVTPSISSLAVPVYITLTFPHNYFDTVNYNYKLYHYDETGTAIKETITPTNVTNDSLTFETSSFSPFAIVATPTGGNTSPTGGNTSPTGGNTSPTGGNTTTGGGTTTVTPVTPDHPSFVSDTNSALSVSNAYTFKITSKDGNAPTFVVGTPGTFIMRLVKQAGNDYFYKITAIGPVGKEAGIYVNGTKLLVATVKSSACNFVSDTYAPLSVKGAYTFKITSKNGKAPTFSVGTPGIFSTSLVKHTGNNYFYKITAIGAPGEQAGIYINGFGCLLVATVKTNPSYVVSDTKGDFKVKAGKSYQFKLTANAKPAFWAGTSSVFKVTFVKRVGNDYFFRVTSAGKAGSTSGFYIKNQKGPVAVATVA